MGNKNHNRPKKKKRKLWYWDFPSTAVFHCRGAEVRSLIGEQRSYKPCGGAKENKSKKKKKIVILSLCRSKSQYLAIWCIYTLKTTHSSGSLLSIAFQLTRRISIYLLSLGKTNNIPGLQCHKGSLKPYPVSTDFLHQDLGNL